MASFSSSLLLAAVLASGVAVGCRNAPSGNDRPAKVAELAFRNESGALACPVMGDVIASPKEAVAREEYAGKAYYFCCTSCVKAFNKDPDKYADGKYLRAKLEAEKDGGEPACGSPGAASGRACGIDD
jgi:YHS domain-containing protein